MPGCCGIFIVHDLSLVERGKGDWNEKIKPFTKKDMIPEIKELNNDLSPELHICALIDRSVEDRNQLSVIKKLGWKELIKTRSNHGRYYIHLLAKKKRKRGK